jgi:lipopolysaccharide transport system ATP-binding protein
VEPAAGGRTRPSLIVERVSKRFRIPHERKTTLLENLLGFFHGGNVTYEEFWALREVSFSVAAGETFGVIGANGGGKSTLLKILAGVLYPDAGSVAVNGQIAPFLELGVGFQPDLSAKENIFLYSAVMGLTREQTLAHYAQVLEFAELKRFESMKLRNFSSGMYLRLAFATAIHTDPDILLVDEVLAVGDAAFQHKCRRKIDQIRSAGKTILLVSHQLDTIRALCSRCLLLAGGQVAAMGATEAVIAEYQRLSG